nr:GNAT family N-acetyltransferase [Cellulosimicrobium sp. CUA-896]
MRDAAGAVVGTGRLLTDPAHPGETHVGRVAVAASARGTGAGAAVVRALEELALAEHAVAGPDGARPCASSCRPSSRPRASTNASATPSTARSTSRRHRPSRRRQDPHGRGLTARRRSPPPAGPGPRSGLPSGLVPRPPARPDHGPSHGPGPAGSFCASSLAPVGSHRTAPRPAARPRVLVPHRTRERGHTGAPARRRGDGSGERGGGWCRGSWRAWRERRGTRRGW